MLLCKKKHFSTISILWKSIPNPVSRLIRIKEQNTFLSIIVSNRARQKSDIIQDIWKDFNAVPTTYLVLFLTAAHAWTHA